LLQLLVGEVDAQLLEAVLIKNFKPEDIQHTNNTCLLTYKYVKNLCVKERYILPF